MEESADERAERGVDAFAAASCQRAGEDVENARAGRDGEDQRGSQEESETMWVEHAWDFTLLWRVPNVSIQPRPSEDRRYVARGLAL